MNIENVQISSLQFDPANMRLHGDRNIGMIAGSLARFGQQRPILVDGDNVVRAGNGTLQAAISLGWSAINIVRTELTGAEAIAYAIADNRSAELAEWDTGSLGEVLSGLLEEDADLLESAGFNQDELLRMIGEEVDDAAAEWSDMPEFVQEKLPYFASLKVNFMDEEHWLAFQEHIGQKLTDKTPSVTVPKQEPVKTTHLGVVDES